MRVLDKQVPDPDASAQGTNPLSIPATPSSVCPADAPVKNFSVVALDRPMKLNPKAPDAIEVDFERKIEMTMPEGKIFALEGEATTVSSGATPHPLTLRANLGDCIKVNLTNKMKASRASFFAPGLAFDPKDSQGLNVGNNGGDQTIGPVKNVSTPITPIRRTRRRLPWCGMAAISLSTHGTDCMAQSSSARAGLSTAIL
ncbi:MAG: hypothetical protein U0236_11410 [Nitrospira sp.]